MSPEYRDPLAQKPPRGRSAASVPSTPSPLEMLNAGFFLDATGQPVLPRILDPFAEGAAPAVMTRSPWTGSSRDRP